jgi:hypothetical protein
MEGEGDDYEEEQEVAKNLEVEYWKYYYEMGGKGKGKAEEGRRDAAVR